MQRLDDLYYWVGERERIRNMKRDGLPRPWTADPVLNTYRFCNVHREDDTVTKWIHNNWTRPHDDRETLPFALCVARMVNLPETLQDLGYPYKWDPRHFVMTLEARKIAGLKVWTSAYMITGGYSAGGETKEAIIARVLEGAHKRLAENPITPRDSLHTAARKIKTPGIGTFLSAQVVADLKRAPVLTGAVDWWSWCSPGPGSTAGLNILHGRERTKRLSDEQFRTEVWEVRELLRHAGTTLDAQNTQNCLCEFSKYIRAKYEGGRLRQTYRPAPIR